MKRYQTILVAAALDDRDATTLRYAAHLARAARANSVYVAHIAPTFDLPPSAVGKQPGSAPPVAEGLQHQLRATVEKERSLFPSDTAVHSVIREGSLVPELVRLAAQKSADVFCLGRRLPQEHDLLSESAMRLVRKAPCSVLVVPPGTEPRYERILVPVDFSDHAREALDVACALAQATPGASVLVQHVYEVPLGWHKSGHSYEEFAAIMKKNAEERWEQFSAGLDFHGVPWTIRFDLGEKVPKAILEAANGVDASLLVLGSHGRTRPASLLLGHVADTVCAHTARPVLCVKRKGEIVNLLHALLQLFEFETP